MNIGEIIQKVRVIENMKDDDELAHVNEDDLRNSFIEYLSNQDHESISSYQIILMAKEVIKTNDIEFSRWCS